MDLFNTISCAVAAAYEAVANRNRQAAVNNRLKAVVRSELATINRAYIALGKHFYNDLRSQAAGDEAVLGNAIDQAKERILKAREKLAAESQPTKGSGKAKVKNTQAWEQDEENDDVLTENLKESPVYHPFVAQAQEAEEDSETEELKMPRPHTGGGESKETF